jgi:ATP-dependent exoDNAse (exonuclease V) beta subunit
MPFEHVKLSELDFDLKSVTTDSGRRYSTPDGKVYPSITTVLSHSTDKTHIFEWRKRIGAEAANKITAKSSSRGTKLHTICENYVLNELNDMKIRMMMPDIKDFFMQLKPPMDQHIGKVYGTEQALFSHRLRLAGRTDCIAEWDGKLSIIDYKNSIREKKEEGILNYFIQGTGYAEMFEDRTGKPVEQVVVLIANEEGKPQVFVKKKEDYLEKLHEYIDNYWKSQ